MFAMRTNVYYTDIWVFARCWEACATLTPLVVDKIAADASGGCTKPPVASGDFVASVDRALRIVRAFDADHDRMTLTEVAGRVDLSRGTARRFLQTLVALGYVDHDGKLFRLTPKVLDLGYAYLSASRLPEAAAPIVRRISDASGESCSVAVREGRHAVYVHRVQPHRIFSSALEIGTRLPAHSSALGQVLLAAMSADARQDILIDATLERFTDRTITDLDRLEDKLVRVARSGYSLVESELEDGIISIAVPIIARSGETVAALNVGASSARTDADTLERDVLPIMLEGAREIGKALAG